MLSGMRSLQEPWCYSGRRGWFSAEWRGNMLACPSPFQKEIQSSGSNGTTSAARPMGGTRMLELPNYQLCWKEKLSQFGLSRLREGQAADNRENGPSRICFPE